MPKIYEYLGFIFFFYSNDHDPFHCHVKRGGKEVKVEFEFEKGELLRVSIRKSKNSKHTLTPAERDKIRTFVEAYYKDMKKKWDDFRAGRPVKSVKINKEIK